MTETAEKFDDPSDAWDAYCSETPPDRRSPQGALAFGFHAAASHDADLRAARERVATLEVLINSPETANWIAGVELEAAHQIERWGVEHDAGKTPLDWFWLIGYLAQKAATSAIAADVNKAKHHTISTGAALLNWHRHLTGENTLMRPGIRPPSEATSFYGAECPSFPSCAGGCGLGCTHEIEQAASSRSTGEA